MAEFDIVDNTTFKMSHGVRDTFVGDKDKGIFEPTVQISPWEDEEDCLKIYKDISASVSKQTDLTDKVNLVWQDSKEIWTMQPFGNYKPTGIKDDYYNWLGAQCLIRIDSKPTIVGDYARFEFKLAGHENMDFHLQPGVGHPLWKAEYKPGTPDWAEWSIAVYHKSKAWSSSGHNYKTGKVCHILRPWCEDNLGNFTWGRWEIGNGIITKLIPKEAFDKGTWWIVDATFGNTSQGANSGNSIKNSIVTTNVGTNPALDGTVDNLHAWVVAVGITARDSEMHLVDADLDLATNGRTDAVSSGTDFDGDMSFPYSGTAPTVLAAGSYIFSLWGDAGAGDVYVYDDFGSGRGYFDINSNQFTWPNPIVGSSSNRIWSLYCEYTAAAGDGQAFRLRAIEKYFMPIFDDITGKIKEIGKYVRGMIKGKKRVMGGQCARTIP